MSEQLIDINKEKRNKLSILEVVFFFIFLFFLDLGSSCVEQAGSELSSSGDPTLVSKVARTTGRCHCALL